MPNLFRRVRRKARTQLPPQPPPRVAPSVSPEHAFHQAVRLDLGVGVQRDAPQAALLYQRAIDDANHVDAMYALANLLCEPDSQVPLDAPRAVQLYSHLIEKHDHTDAMFRLGCLLRTGAPGVQKDVNRAAELLEQAAETGHSAAISVLEMLALAGVTEVRKNPRRVKQLFECAMEREDEVIAVASLAFLWRKGMAQVMCDAETEKHLYERLIQWDKSKDGEVHHVCRKQVEKEGKSETRDGGEQVSECFARDAMFNLALLLNNGTGVEKDARRAARLYRKIIDREEDTGAMINLGNMMRAGGEEGVWQNGQKAKELYSRAMNETGYIWENRHIAKYNLASLLWKGAADMPKDPVQAVRLLNQIIDEDEETYVQGADGDVDELSMCTMVALANIYLRGTEGIEKDALRAVELYKRAIREYESRTAMFELGLLYQNGAPGVAKQPKKAVEMYEQAVEHQSVGAIVNLGYLLKNGARGVPKNQVRAAALYKRAISQAGNIIAMYNLGLMYEEGVGGLEQDVKQAVELYERAVKEGQDMDAQRRLARYLWVGGQGVRRDRKRALELVENVVSVEGKMRDLKELGSWLIDEGAGRYRDVDRATKLLQRALRKCRKSEDRKEIVGLLEKCEREGGGSGRSRGKRRKKRKRVVIVSLRNETI